MTKFVLFSIVLLVPLGTTLTPYRQEVCPFTIASKGVLNIDWYLIIDINYDQKTFSLSQEGGEYKYTHWYFPANKTLLVYQDETTLVKKYANLTISYVKIIVRNSNKQDVYLSSELPNGSNVPCELLCTDPSHCNNRTTERNSGEDHETVCPVTISTNGCFQIGWYITVDNHYNNHFLFNQTYSGCYNYEPRYFYSNRSLQIYQNGTLLKSFQNITIEAVKIIVSGDKKQPIEVYGVSEMKKNCTLECLDCNDGRREVTSGSGTIKTGSLAILLALSIVVLIIGKCSNH